MKGFIVVELSGSDCQLLARFLGMLRASGARPLPMGNSGKTLEVTLLKTGAIRGRLKTSDVRILKTDAAAIGAVLARYLGENLDDLWQRLGPQGYMQALKLAAMLMLKGDARRGPKRRSEEPDEGAMLFSIYGERHGRTVLTGAYNPLGVVAARYGIHERTLGRRLQRMRDRTPSTAALLFDRIHPYLARGKNQK